MNIHTPAGLDAFIDHLESGAAIILADMGTGSGQLTATQGVVERKTTIPILSNYLGSE